MNLICQACHQAILPGEETDTFHGHPFHALTDECIAAAVRGANANLAALRNALSSAFCVVCSFYYGYEGERPNCPRCAPARKVLQDSALPAAVDTPHPPSEAEAIDLGRPPENATGATA